MSALVRIASVYSAASLLYRGSSGSIADRCGESLRRSECDGVPWTDSVAAHEDGGV